MRAHLITENPTTGQQFRLSDDQGREAFSHYGLDGSGFGYLRFYLPRRAGYNYRDVGFGYPVSLRKGPYRVLFDGQIVKVSESSGGERGLEVWALGWIHVLSADIHNHIYCDNRLAKWRGSELKSGSFTPQKFDYDTSEGIYMKPRMGTIFQQNDYTYLRYEFPFGEIAKRITASYSVALPGPFPGKLEVRDMDGNVLWSSTSTGSGTINLTTSGTPAGFEVRFYVTAFGESTADDDTVYGKLTNVKVYSTTELVDAGVVARGIVNLLSGPEHGLSPSVGDIASPGRALIPAAFDADMTPHEVMSWCAGFGDEAGEALAWGVRFDDRRTLFLETMDSTTVGYKVGRNRAQVSTEGDWGASAQVVYGVYQDEVGNVLRTADRSADDVIVDLGGQFRRKPISVQCSDEDTVNSLLDLWLAENARPGAAGSIRVAGGLYDPSGRFVPYDEVLPGTLFQITDFRAHEAMMTPNDYRDNTTTFQITGVTWNEESRTVELIPRRSSDAFERQMTIIQALQEAL